MEFPFGHHHRRREDEEEEEGRRPYPPPGYQPPLPPPSYYGAGDEGFGHPAPYSHQPPIHHVSHEGSFGHPAPYSHQPPIHHVSHEGSFGHPAPYPPQPPIHHVSHEGSFGHPPPQVYPPTASYGRQEQGGFGHQHNYHEPPPPTHHEGPHRPDPPPYSGSVHHVTHEKVEGRPGNPARQPTVRIYTRAEPNYSLSIRDGNVILAHNNPSDERQHWIKDLRYSTKVKDEEGFPAFSLVNKATGEAIKHSIGKTYPVRLVRYNPEYLDESVLWAESKDVGDGFRCIRMVNNIRLNFDAFHGDKDHGGVKDGTTVVLWDWLKGDNQKWKIVSY